MHWYNKNSGTETTLGPLRTIYRYKDNKNEVTLERLQTETLQKTIPGSNAKARPKHLFRSLLWAALKCWYSVKTPWPQGPQLVWLLVGLELIKIEFFGSIPWSPSPSCGCPSLKPMSRKECLYFITFFLVCTLNFVKAFVNYRWNYFFWEEIDEIN